MSEALDKVLGITQLPIFPLPLVLLPNELLPLHIFEPKYQQMLTDVSKGKNIFGVSYFESKETFIDNPKIGAIGCAAEVTERQELPDGRSNVLTVGVVRFQIIDYVETDAPYLVAAVEFFEDDLEDLATIEPQADEIFALFTRVAEAAHKLSGERGAFPEIPQAEPQALSFLVTAAFNLEDNLKYEMLETRLTSERLKKLREILLKAVEKMEESATINEISKTNGHAKKKIDL